jgi:hypothetical protein
MLYEVILSLNAAYGGLVTISHVTSYVTDGIVRQLQCKLPEGFIVMGDKNVSLKTTKVVPLQSHCNRYSHWAWRFLSIIYPLYKSRVAYGTRRLITVFRTARQWTLSSRQINPFTTFPTYSLSLGHYPPPNTYGSQEMSWLRVSRRTFYTDL